MSTLLGLRKTLSTGDIEDSLPATLDSILVTELQTMTATDLDVLLSLETQARVDHQERVKMQEIKPISSRLKFDLPLTPPKPKSPDSTTTTKRRWSLPIIMNNKNRRFTWSKLFTNNKQQQRSSIVLGSKVKLFKRPLPLIGTVKYMGQVHFDTGEWLGVELDYRGTQ